ncbi:tandem-95 repeat protein [Microvirga aerilata]|uniref:tandem-95 repeat protein n=1 Tax=Microvirga aerilata TaxID=670292 RepID=UPI003630F3A8
MRPGSTQKDADIFVSAVEILDCSGYGFDPHEQTIRLTIENSVAHGNGLDGFVADYIIDGIYRNNIAYDNDRHGFNITTTATNLLLSNNEAYSNGSAGVVVQRGSENIPWPSDIQIVGGKYYNNAREGILTRMADDVTVDGATVYGNLRQGVRVEGSTDTTIQNSTIYNNSQAGQNAYDEVQIIQRADSTTGHTYYSTNTKILSNNIYSDGAIDARYGVREEPTNDDAGATGTVVSGNTITGMASGTVSTPSSADNPVVAADDTYNATEDAVLSVGAAQGVLANDTATDGGKAAVAGQITTAQGGTVALSNDGSFTYTPKSNFFGSDSFTYAAMDVDGDRDTGTVTLNVRDVAETDPQPPTSGLPAIGIGTTQLEALALSRFTLVGLSSAEGGQAVENRNKDLEATAKGTFTGESGTYKIKVAYYDESDGASPMGIRVNGATAASWIADKQLGSTGSDTRTLTSYEVQLQLTKGATVEIYGTRKDAELVRIDALTVEPVGNPTPPADNPVVAANDTYSATEDKVLTVSAAQGVLANDTALDGNKAAVAGQITTAQGGTVALSSDGSFTYTPKVDFFGSDSFSYTAFDTDGDQATGTVTLNVQDVPENTPRPHITVSGDRRRHDGVGIVGAQQIHLDQPQLGSRWSGGGEPEQRRRGYCQGNVYGKDRHLQGQGRLL